jgi:3-oxoacyl-[acyl-carrier-protein] synthase-1
MAPQPLAISSTGLVTSVGLSAPAALAAIRAKLACPTETRFVDSSGEWITGHRVPLEKPWVGLTRLAKMAAMAIDECLNLVPRTSWADIPLLLCVAEPQRPGRLDGLDDKLFLQIEHELGVRFDSDSGVISRGRVGVALALARARELIHEHGSPRVLIAATDSLLSGPTLDAYERSHRLLTGANPNGFIAGEAGGALLVEVASGEPQLCCTGIGFGLERAHITSEEPLRAEGLTQAIMAALADSGRAPHDMDFRITDISGEQYYFKEAALAVARILRQRKEEFDLWHPAECVGETGAAAGVVICAVAEAACRNGYAPGANVLAHMVGDAGERAAAVLKFGSG